MDSFTWAAAHEYACAHITTNYAAFTEGCCENTLSILLKTLGEEYTTMAHTRTDPMGDFSRVLGLATLKDDLDLDALEVAPECAEFTVKLLKGWQRSSGHIVSGDAWNHEEEYSGLLTPQPVWPVTRKNPLLRSRESTRPETRWPKNYVTLHQHPTFSAGSIPSSNPPTPVLEEDDVLQLRFEVPPDASAYVRPFLRSMKYRPDTFYDLCADPPIPPLVPLEGRISPPLFTTVRRNNGQHDLGKDQSTRFSALGQCVLLNAVDEPKSDDILDEHLVVVNGWHAFAPRSSPSPLHTPSLGSDSSESDELGLRSPSPILTSPDPDAKIGDFLKVVFQASAETTSSEPVLLPRSQRLDGVSLRQCAASASRDQSFGDFVKAVAGAVPRTGRASPAGASFINDYRTHPVNDVSSLLAHASDMFGGDGVPRLSDSESVEDVLPIAEEDPVDFIMGEQHEEYRERLPVPVLPRPSLMSAVPKTMSQLLKCSDDGPSRRQFFRPCLRKVVIQKSLTKDLTWTPFPAKERIPADDKLLDVDSDVKDFISGVILAEPSGDLGRLTSLVSVERGMDQALDLMQDAGDGEDLRHAFLQHDDLVLDDVALRELVEDSIFNRHDRRRLQGLPDLAWSTTNAEGMGQWSPRKRMRVERPSAYLPTLELDWSLEVYQLPGEVCRAMAAEATSRTSSSISLSSTSRRISSPPIHVDLRSPPREVTQRLYIPDHIPNTVKGPWLGSFLTPPHTVVDVKTSVLKSPPFQQAQITATANVDKFLRLRSAYLRLTTSSTGNAFQEFISVSEHDIDATDRPTPAVPENLLNASTLALSDIGRPPSAPHCYLASIDFIQRSALVSALKSPHTRVTLVERQDMDGADLFLDPYTAICVIPLLLLPTTCSSLLDRIVRLTTRCEHLLILFEAYSPSHSISSRSPAFASSNVFSPLVLKAVQTLRRSVAIAVARDTTAFSANVRYGFATSTAETAAFIRAFGDDAEERHAATDVLWDDRRWLSSEESQEESDLAQADGMNAFAAAVILAQTSFNHFLNMTSEVRCEQFAYLIGDTRVDTINAIMTQRLQLLESALPPPSPLTSSDT